MIVETLVLFCLPFMIGFLRNTNSGCFVRDGVLDEKKVASVRSEAEKFTVYISRAVYTCRFNSDALYSSFNHVCLDYDNFSLATYTSKPGK